MLCFHIKIVGLLTKIIFANEKRLNLRVTAPHSILAGKVWDWRVQWESKVRICWIRRFMYLIPRGNPMP